MKTLMSKEWWAGTAERAIKTFAQVAVGFITAGVTGVADVPWETMLSVSAVAMLASVLMRFSTLNEAPKELTVIVNGNGEVQSDLAKDVAKAIENN